MQKQVELQNVINQMQVNHFMDLKKTITNIESELSRLEQQKIQEAAMLEVLPARYELNMKAFSEKMPEIYSFFKNYKPVKKFRFY